MIIDDVSTFKCSALALVVPTPFKGDVNSYPYCRQPICWLASPISPMPFWMPNLDSHSYGPSDVWRMFKFKGDWHQQFV